jgi:hypothetical protein
MSDLATKLQTEIDAALVRIRTLETMLGQFEAEVAELRKRLAAVEIEATTNRGFLK